MLPLNLADGLIIWRRRGAAKRMSGRTGRRRRGCPPNLARLLARSTRRHSCTAQSGMGEDAGQAPPRRETLRSCRKQGVYSCCRAYLHASLSRRTSCSWVSAGRLLDEVMRWFFASLGGRSVGSSAGRWLCRLLELLWHHRHCYHSTCEQTERLTCKLATLPADRITNELTSSQTPG